jgi:NAD-dependent dihydropyrimidine dehydrogenase PreA subunit
MKRDIVKINEDLCDGCGQCIPNCHEGALQIIDGKARLISDLMCDGLGACLGHCPQGAISIEQREADAYDEVKVMELMVAQGKNTVIAHLIHLKEHGEHEFMKQGLGYLMKNKEKLGFSIEEVTHTVHNSGHKHDGDSCHSGGCPGSKSVNFASEKSSEISIDLNAFEVRSQLTHWPVQMHLINPLASHFQSSDLVLAADCVAFSMGDFHGKFLKGKTLAIACPKLDSGLEIYMEKIVRLIDDAKINTLTVMMMEVPCCGGLLQIVKQAASMAKRKVPVKAIVIGIKGDILSEEWV